MVSFLRTPASPDVVATALGTDPSRGLGEVEAAARLAAVGPNLIARTRRPPYARIAARQLADPLVALLVAAAVVSAGIGELLEGAVIAAIVVLNAVLGFVQEAGAERALLALSRIRELSANVVRDGSERAVPAAELVPGDLVVVREGDRVPADARIVAAERIAADESLLTGESAPREKAADAVPAGTPLAERRSMLYAGTGITRGRGTAIVSATGSRTELGQIARLAAAAKPPPTPLQRRLASLSRAMLALGAAVMGLLAAGMLLRGASLHEAFLVGVAVAVAAVPEGLAATVTIALAQGARAMAARGAIVRRLSAVETLGSASVIATDKTGTLTLNQLRVVAIEPVRGARECDVIELGVLASTAELVDGEEGVAIAGDHVDGAFLLAARERGMSDARKRPARQALLELPFDPERKRLTIVYDDHGERRVAVKGALETLLVRSSLDVAERDRIEAVADAWARQGLRVLAVADRTLQPGVQTRRPRRLEPDMCRHRRSSGSAASRRCRRRPGGARGRNRSGDADGRSPLDRRVDCTASRPRRVRADDGPAARRERRGGARALRSLPYRLRAGDAGAQAAARRGVSAPRGGRRGDRRRRQRHACAATCGRRRCDGTLRD